MRKSLNISAENTGKEFTASKLAAKVRKIVCMTVISAMAFTAISISGACDEVSAATKTPATPSITSTYVDGQTVTIKWGGAKRATGYQVALRSQSKSWKYLKKVKKTSKNKRKYTKKNLYKVKKSGRYYKVYKYRYTYTILKTTSKSARSATCNLSKGDHTYTLCVRAKAKKTASSWRTKSVKTHSHKHTWEKVYREETSVEVKPVLVTENVTEFVRREAFCDECGEVVATTNEEGKDPLVTVAMSDSHEEETGHMLSVDFNDVTETKEVTRETGETEEVTVINQVLDHYKCDCKSNTACYAEKDLKGNISFHNHVWGEEYISAAPTCEEKGTRTIECLDCGIKKNASIAATGHSLTTREGTKIKYKEETVLHEADVCGCGYKTEDQAAWSAHRDTCNGWNAWVENWTTVEKVPYEVLCTETYCTVCDKVTDVKY